jgi:quinol monooxygenase YgiN
MIHEVAIFTAVEGKADELGPAILRGLEVIRQHPACISARVERCIEQPDRYMLVVAWTSLEAHMQDFRGGPLLPLWRSHITGLHDGNPSVLHYSPLEKE